jgi:peptidyl-dipeptidase Dcp
MLLETVYKDFIWNGANITPENKERFREVNEELSVLTLQFEENVLADTKNYKLIIEKEEDLAGLPEESIIAASEKAKSDSLDGKWIFTVQKTSMIPFLQYAENRELRKQLLTAYNNLGNNDNEYDNKEIINKIVNLRLEKSKLLGYNNFAEYRLSNNMAKTPEKVYELLDKLWDAAILNAKEEVVELQQIIDKEGGKFKLEAWDWSYYTEKLKKEKYNLEDEVLKPYFQLNNVIEGAFMVANKLYGLTFEKVENIPVYHPDVVVYEVKDSDGSHLGLIYSDFFTRDSKGSGAWMDNFRKQSRQNGEENPPIVTLNCNFAKPSGATPTLLSFEEVETIFHEFGHVLHGLLSDCNYYKTSGTSVARDFVELPSQIMENWATEPEVLKLYAKHYQTGEVLPEEILDKIIESSKFNQGFTTVEYLSAALLDLDWHTITENSEINVTEFEKKSLDNLGLIPEIVVRYRSTYFKHIFSSSYAAGYYSYIWAEVIEADTYGAFEENGIFDQATAKSFRDNILSKGGTVEPMQMFINFRGREPQIDALLKRRGLEG